MHLVGAFSFMTLRTAEIVRSYFKAWCDRDRAAIESVIGEDFHFTSPLDNRLDRRTYFERCWPGGEQIASIDIQRLEIEGDRAFVTYELSMKDGQRFRNTELLTLRGGKVTDVEVYFGWTIPHKAPPGGFVDEA